MLITSTMGTMINGIWFLAGEISCHEVNLNDTLQVCMGTSLGIADSQNGKEYHGYTMILPAKHLLSIPFVTLANFRKKTSFI